MSRALLLADRGLYTTMPNPRVGCVIVKDGKIVGEGVHLKAGEPHAEVLALRQAGDQAAGAIAYVTLEPCSHHGRTPPCVEALVKAKIAQVVIAMQDPNPLVSGQGVAYLQKRGIQANVGLMQAEAQALNAGFISRMVHQKPFVRCKIAASLDGKTALTNGQSQWITGAAARNDVQRWRAQSCAILTGIGTVLQDNPSLTVRALDIGRQPVKVVVDSQLRMPLEAKILQQGQLIIAYAIDPHHQAEKLTAMGVELFCIPNEQQQVCLNTLLVKLGEKGFNELMVEAGEALNGALLTQRLVDELLLYYAPKLMGTHAKGMFNLPLFDSMQQSLALELLDVRQVGADIRIRARVSNN